MFKTSPIEVGDPRQRKSAKEEKEEKEQENDNGQANVVKDGKVSRRGVGQSWEHSDKHVELFGAGGHQDGAAVALIRSNNNAQLEDEIALYGQGDQMIDENMYTRSHANANPEFNFSQFKHGASTYDDYANMPGIGPLTSLHNAGLSSGDMHIKVDPHAKIVDATSKALGDIYDGYGKVSMGGLNLQPGDRVGDINPFLMTGLNKNGLDPSEIPGMNDDPIPDNGEDDPDEYYNYPYEGGKEAQEAVNMHARTGLRRVNTRTNQQRQLEKAATKEQLERAYNEANSQYADVLHKYGGSRFLSRADREDTLSMLRTPNARYHAQQGGVSQVSRDNARSFKRSKKSGMSKLANVIVGV